TCGVDLLVRPRQAGAMAFDRSLGAGAITLTPHPKSKTRGPVLHRLRDNILSRTALSTRPIRSTRASYGRRARHGHDGAATRLAYDSRGRVGCCVPARQVYRTQSASTFSCGHARASAALGQLAHTLLRPRAEHVQ